MPMMPAHPLVAAQWPPLTEVPAYDYATQGDEVHLGVYVRRIAGDGWFALAGLINHVVVDPAARGEGLGTKAVEDAKLWLILSRVPFALVHCDPDTIGFYERLEFARAPDFPAPQHNGPRVSMVAEILLPYWHWPNRPVTYVEPW